MPKRSNRKKKTPPPPPAAPDPRVTVGTALCHAGLDERALGERWVRMLANLSDPAQRENATIQKLLLDALKECTRQLDNDHDQQRANVVVHLVHAVPRPPSRQAGALRPIPALPSAPPENEAVSTTDPQNQEPS